MRSLPPSLSPYRCTPVFTADTVPKGLRRNHKTAAGVWALIHVTEGALLYRIAATGEEHRLVPSGPPGVIEAEALHSVEPLGPVRFYVEFWR